MTGGGVGRRTRRGSPLLTGASWCSSNSVKRRLRQCSVARIIEHRLLAEAVRGGRQPQALPDEHVRRPNEGLVRDRPILSWAMHVLAVRLMKPQNA